MCKIHVKFPGSIKTAPSCEGAAFRVFLVCGNHTGCGDDLVCLTVGSVGEEGLSGFAQLHAVLGDQYERTLDGVGLILDGLLAGSHALDLDGLDGVLHRSQGRVADGAGVLGNCGDNVTGGGQLLTVLAGILNTDDLFEAAAGAGTGLTADQNDLCVSAADFGPVGDLAGEDLGDGEYGEKDVDYIKRKSSTSNGESSGGGGTSVIPVPTPTTDPVQVPLPTEKGTPDNVEPQINGTSSGAKLNYNDHIAYINGYDNGDGTTVVRP